MSKMSAKCDMCGKMTNSGRIEMIVKPIPIGDTKDFILKKHYAQRMPSISFAYGMFINNKLEGVLTIGKPASNSLCIGVMGKEYKDKVYELNRLVINEGFPKNTLSQFVGKVLRDLKTKDLILISYADEGMKHKGYIYQATNWIYTGMTKPRTDKYTPNGKHSRHYTDEFNHLRKYRTPKHRYVYFTDRKKAKKYISLLKYPILKYPKGENGKYELGTRQKTKILNTITGEIFYE